jgi:hypothetical protein
MDLLLERAGFFVYNQKNKMVRRAVEREFEIKLKWKIFSIQIGGGAATFYKSVKRCNAIVRNEKRLIESRWAVFVKSLSQPLQRRGTREEKREKIKMNYKL